MASCRLTSGRTHASILVLGSIDCRFNSAPRSLQIPSKKKAKKRDTSKKKPRFTGITRLSNSRIDGRIAPAISQKQQTLAQRQRLFPDMMLEDCQDCILVGRAGHLLLTVDCNSNRTSRISIRGGGIMSSIEYFKLLLFKRQILSNIFFKRLTSFTARKFLPTSDRNETNP